MKKYLILAMLLMGSVLTIGAQETNEDPDIKYAADLLKPGTPAPEFVINFKDSTKNIPLSKLRGHYVVIDFWASWCPDCRKDIPQVRELNRTYQRKGVAFIGVSFDTDREAWKNCIEKNEMSWLHYSELKKWKKETKIDRDYHINWIPTYYLIDPDGKVVLGTVMIEKIGEKLAALDMEGLLEESGESLAQLLGHPVPPMFPGGNDARNTYMTKNLKYPDIAKKYGAQGEVTMNCEVETDGTLTNFEAKDCVITSYDRSKFDKLTQFDQDKVKQQISLAFAKEAYNVMKGMPKWIPAVKDGKPVKVKLHQTVRYSLRK